MKGFPNQVADFGKLALAMRCIVELEDAEENPRDEGLFGIALVRAGVAGTGHRPKPIDQYIKEQLKKPLSGQSFRATARGLRQLFTLMRLITDDGETVSVTERGRVAATFADAELEGAQVDFWRRVVRDMEHEGSHPYLVLLKLVGRKPGISRAKCALALEAKDDTKEELERIAALADLDEEKIKTKIKVSDTNWDNAKKILPRFAEQLDDVIRTGGNYVLADAPGRADAGPAFAAGDIRSRGAVRTPRSSREVTADSIGRAGTGAESDEVPPPPPEADPAAAQKTIQLRAGRLRRHNLLVQDLAARFAQRSARLFEDPFDVLAVTDSKAILVEVKSLSGDQQDERDRVRDAFSQLPYYEAFLTQSVVGETPISKVACFERPITAAHSKWMNDYQIAVIWYEDGQLRGDALAKRFLSGLLKEFD